MFSLSFSLFIVQLNIYYFVSAVEWAKPIKGGVVCIVPISRFVCKVILYLCAKFGAFIIKCTIVMYFSVNPPHYFTFDGISRKIVGDGTYVT